MSSQTWYIIKRIAASAASSAVYIVFNEWQYGNRGRKKRRPNRSYRPPKRFRKPKAQNHSRNPYRPIHQQIRSDK